MLSGDRRSLPARVSRIRFYVPLRYPEEDSASRIPSSLLWLLAGELSSRADWIPWKYDSYMIERSKQSSHLKYGGKVMKDEWKYEDVILIEPPE